MTPLTPGATARRMHGLVEPIGLIPYAAAEPAEALLELGLRDYWDTYFAGQPRWAAMSRPASCTRSSTTSLLARPPATSRVSGT